jgi:hypothetical protein
MEILILKITVFVDREVCEALSIVYSCHVRTSDSTLSPCPKDPERAATIVRERTLRAELLTIVSMNVSQVTF